MRADGRGHHCSRRLIRGIRRGPRMTAVSSTTRAFPDPGDPTSLNVTPLGDPGANYTARGRGHISEPGRVSECGRVEATLDVQGRTP